MVELLNVNNAIHMVALRNVNNATLMVELFQSSKRLNSTMWVELFNVASPPCRVEVHNVKKCHHGGVDLQRLHTLTFSSHVIPRGT